MVGPTKVAAVAQSVDHTEPCLYSVLQVAASPESLRKGEYLFAQPRVADKFNLQSASGPIHISTANVSVLVHPKPETLHTVEFIPPSSQSGWEKIWGVKEPEAVSMITEANKAGSAQVQCLNFGTKMFVTGYLTGESKMAFTVSSPFTLSFAEESDVIETLYSRISHAYLGCAFIVMMMATLGLAIFTNSVLRARVNLPFESVDFKSLPWSKARANNEEDHVYWTARLGIRLGDIQYQSFAQLPSFYRYHWDDGLILRGRKVFLTVHDRGLTLLEMTAAHQPKSFTEVAWGDLFCIYFTKWNSKQTWFDIVTRSGERYQMALTSPDQLRELLKKWDATQILDQKSNQNSDKNKVA